MIHFLAYGGYGGGAGLGNISGLVPLIVIGAICFFLRQKVQTGYIILILILGVALASTSVGQIISQAINSYGGGLL